MKKEVQMEKKESSNEPQSMKDESHARKTKPKANIHKSTEQLAEQKRQRNRRYQRNHNEMKQFWQSQNSNYVHREKSSNQNVKARSHANHVQCSHYHSCNPQKPTRNFAPKPSFSKKPVEKPISHHSQPTKASPKDVKGKGKLVSDSEAQTKKSTTNPKKVEKEFVKNQIKNKRKQFDSKETKMKDNKKYEATPKLKNFIKQIELQLRKLVCNVRNDNGLEFKNQEFEEFLTQKAVSHNFSDPYTPQQNDVVERCFNFHSKEQRNNFDAKADEGIF
ncbi:hypothetical protein Lser_V15G29646 [Lactuca serriola]